MKHLSCHCSYLKAMYWSQIYLFILWKKYSGIYVWVLVMGIELLLIIKTNILQGVFFGVIEQYILYALLMSIFVMILNYVHTEWITTIDIIIYNYSWWCLV